MSTYSRFAVLMLALLLAVPMFAATQNAVLYGTVYDAAANPVAGVTVTLENSAFNFVRVTTTASDGSYSFAEVPPAPGYKLTAAKDGQTIDIRTGLSVNVGEESVVAPPLKAQAVTASGKAPEVVAKSASEMAVKTETVSTAQSGVITGEQLRSLPLYNRNFLTLGTLTPNTHDLGAADPLLGASFSVSGNRGVSNSFLLDGSDNVASGSNQAVPFQVNDSIQEFRVISSGATAEYGRGQGGVVNVVTKRGTDGFHGSTFGYFGNDMFDSGRALSVYNGSGFDRAATFAGPTTPVFAGLDPISYNDYVSSAIANFGACTDGTSPSCNTFFDPAAVLATRDRRKQPFDSKQFGINAGGALMKGKWFAFGSYEGTLIDNPTPVFERVPSTFDKTYDPYGTGAFGFGALDPNYVLAQNVLALYPTANVVAVPNALEFYQGFAPNNTKVHNFLVRSDIVQSDKTTWSVRYAAQKLNQLHDATLPATTAYAGNGANRGALNQNLNVTATHAFSPKLIMEARAGFSRFRVNETAQDAGFNATTIGLPNSAMMTFLLAGIDPQYSGATPGANGAMAGWADSFWNASGNILPTLDGIFPMARIGAPLYAPSQQLDNTVFVGNTWSWNRGRHSWRFGAEYRNLRNDVMSGAFSRGYVTSGNIGEFTSDSATCNASCGEAFLAPSFDSAVRTGTPFVGSFRAHAYSFFAQDTYRISSRVTLNYGLRYDYFGPPREKNDQLWNFDFTARGLVQQNGTAVSNFYGLTCPAGGFDPATPMQSQYANAGFISTTLPWECSETGNNRIARPDRNNFAPRLGLAWDVFGTGNTVVRMGGGMYYNQLPVNYVAQLMFNRPTVLDPDNPSSIFGQNFNGGACGTHCGLGNSSLDPAVIVLNGAQGNQSATAPFGAYAIDQQRFTTPYSWQLNGSIQQQFGNNMVGELGYVGNYARALPIVYNGGWTNNWGCTQSPTSFCNQFALAPIFTMTNQAQSTYHSLLARVRVASWHGLRWNGTYNWSSAFDNASSPLFPQINYTHLNGAFQTLQTNGNPTFFCILGFGGGCPGTPPASIGGSGAVTTTGAGAAITSPYFIPQDPRTFLKDEYGRSDYNSTHRFVSDFTYAVPSLQKLWNWPKWADHWQFSGIFSAQSGQPFSIFSGPGLGAFTQRVNVTGAVGVTDNPNAAISGANLALPGPDCVTAGGNQYVIPGSGGSLFDGTTPTACAGNSRRNAFTGPGFINMNFAIQKGFPIFGEGKLLTFRTEFYNMFNRANYYNPISLYTFDGTLNGINPDFGKIKSVRDPRQIQFAVRFNW